MQTWDRAAAYRRFHQRKYRRYTRHLETASSWRSAGWTDQPGQAYPPPRRQCKTSAHSVAPPAPIFEKCPARRRCSPLLQKKSVPHGLHPDQRRSTGLELVRGNMWHSRRDGRVAAMSPLIIPVGLPPASRLIEPLTKSGGSGVLAECRNLHRAAVQKHLVIGLLQRHGIIRRDEVEFPAAEGPRVIGELLMGPPADVKNPFPCALLFGTSAQHVDGLFSRIHAVPPKFVDPGLSPAQQVHVIVDQPGNDGLPLRSIFLVSGLRAVSFPDCCQRRRCDRLGWRQPGRS